MHNGHHFFFFGAAARKSPLQPALQKIYFRPGLYHLSFLPVLPVTAAFTVAESGTPDDGTIGQPTGLEGHDRGLL